MVDESGRVRWPLPSRRVALFLVAGGACLVMLPLLAHASSAAALPTTTWQAGAPLGTGLEGMAGGYIGGKFYVSHGYPMGTPLSAYDPVADTWTTLPAASVGRSELTGAVAVAPNGHASLYAIGGKPCSPVCNNVEIYDPVANSWSTGAPMPTARAGLGSAVIGNDIYVVGGRLCAAPYCGPPINTMEIYHVATDSWTTGPAMPTAAADVYATLAYNGKVYVFGGETGPGAGTDIGLVQIFDPGTNAWSLGPAMPTPRANAIAGLCGGDLFVIGGTVSNFNVDVVEALDPTTWQWHTMGSMLIASSEMASGAVTGPDMIFAAGSGVFGRAASTAFVMTCDHPVEDNERSSSLDSDLDGIEDRSDNCAAVPNHEQEDSDLDSIGDPCDPTPCPSGKTWAADSARSSGGMCITGNPPPPPPPPPAQPSDLDYDSVPDARDNCPATANREQANMDEDLLGDSCDPDIDGDGVPNEPFADDVVQHTFLDNCPTEPNGDQTDANHDGVGDACQPEFRLLAASVPTSGTSGASPLGRGIPWPLVGAAGALAAVITVPTVFLIAGRRRKN
ncbi:MAG: thrombospondin type 3 repeat-containing protein [bacterium]